MQVVERKKSFKKRRKKQHEKQPDNWQLCEWFAVHSAGLKEALFLKRKKKPCQNPKKERIAESIRHLKHDITQVDSLHWTFATLVWGHCNQLLQRAVGLALSAVLEWQPHRSQNERALHIVWILKTRFENKMHYRFHLSQLKTMIVAVGDICL